MTEKQEKECEMIKVFVASSNELKDERDELAVPVLG